MHIYDSDSKNNSQYLTIRHSFSDNSVQEDSSPLSTMESTELGIIHQNLLDSESDDYGTLANVTQIPAQIGTRTYNMCDRLSKNIKLAVGIGLGSVAVIIISALIAENKL